MSSVQCMSETFGQTDGWAGQGPSLFLRTTERSPLLCFTHFQNTHRNLIFGAILTLFIYEHEPKYSVDCFFHLLRCFSIIVIASATIATTTTADADTATAGSLLLLQLLPLVLLLLPWLLLLTDWLGTGRPAFCPRRRRKIFPLPSASSRLWGPPNLQYNGYRASYRGLMRPGLAANISPPSCAVS
jgi:hypothetical protein